MTFVFLMDPLETVNVHKDTTLMLMLSSHKKGHHIYFLSRGGIVLKDSRVFFNTTQLIPQYNEQRPFILKKTSTLSQEEVDCVFIRTDPPFDARYLLDTWLLDRLPSSVTVINSPSGIRTANEKLWATQFPKLVPPTLVSNRKEEILSFLDQYQEIILKPTDGYGGQTVFYIRKGDKNTNVIIEVMTRGGTYAVAQRYLPESQDGDKRILILDGEPLGAVLRHHAKDDHRNNFFAGGKPLPAKITKRDQEIIHALKPALKKLGLYFVGIDVIGDYLIEVNVTSPTCVQEINRLNGCHLENDIIQFAEKLVRKNKKG